MPNSAPVEAPPSAAAVRTRPRALLAMHRDLAARLISTDTMARMVELADFDPELVIDDFSSPEGAAALASAEVIISSWGCPPLTDAVLAAAPELRAVLHAAGSVKHHITDACWDRGLGITSAAYANALPVAEFTVAAVLFSNKPVLRLAADYRARRAPHDWQAGYPEVGNYRRTVGIVGASRIGRRVLELLAPYDFELLLHDPYVTVDQAAAMGADLVSMDELCTRSDVLSVHAPELPETRHLVDARRIALLPDGATLINTSRGSLIDQDALTAELVTGRIHAVLDVTVPETLPADSPLYDLPNVLLTPHIAGSLGGELHRMAAAAADELARYVEGLPFAHPVTREEIARTA
ncbi:hydroxyacid dehydrogenase [Kitasatospora griseola]